MNLPALKLVKILPDITAEALARLLLQFQGYVVESLGQLLSRPRALSVTQDVELVAAVTKVVSHKLPLPPGRVPSGWLITDINVNTTVRRDDWDDKTISLVANNNCTIRLEVW